MATDVGLMAPVMFAEGLESVVRDSEQLSASVETLAADVRVTLAVSTLSGEPIQEQRGTLTPDNIEDFRPHPKAEERAVARAEELGLTVIKRGRFGITVSGPADLVREVCGTELVVQTNARFSDVRSTQEFSSSFAPLEPTDLFLVPQNSLTIPAAIDDSIDDFVFIPPPILFAPDPSPPAASFHNIGSGDIRHLLNVPNEFDGSGIRVGVVDTGFYEHPYYKANTFDYQPIATASAPDAYIDDHGHGTAITFNVFATAPGARVCGYKQTNPPQIALEDAADEEADIISCSWGYDREQVFPILQATILSIIADGVIVLFAAGNGHYAWPGSEPSVLSIGGAFWNEKHKLEASNYASGYLSSLFPGRRVPDVSGLCGERPKAIYIIMPTQPDNLMDRTLSGTPHPSFDETDDDDGWVGASGTSSATPQVAGIVAMMLQKARQIGRTLDTSDVRAILESSAVPITQGRNAMGFPAVGQPNVAVGWGLVDARAALAQV
ncbi:MAG: S8 family serine peptidase [Pseudomonadota bacterium]